MAPEALKIFTKEGYAIKLLVELIQKSITNTGFFFVTEDEIRFEGVDKSNNSKFIYVILKRINFPKYFYNKEILGERFVIGVNIAYMYTILKGVRKKDYITLNVREDSLEELEICVHHGGEEESKATVSYLAMIKREIIQESQNTQLCFDLYNDKEAITVDVAEFQKLKPLGKEGLIQVKSKPRYIKFEVSNQTLYSSNVHFGEISSQHTDTPFLIQNYDIGIICNIVKTSSISKDVKIYSSYDSPLRFTLSIGPLGTMDIFIKASTSST
jgi:hypothetical protein